MSRESSDRPPALTVDHVAREEASPVETAATPAGVVDESKAGGEGRRPLAELAAIDGQHHRMRRRFASPPRQRLGAVEHALLALIALGVAITIVMAIVNP